MLEISPLVVLGSQAQAGVATFEISAISIRAELIASVEKSGG
jgi:hypothetical protein